MNPRIQTKIFHKLIKPIIIILTTLLLLELTLYIIGWADPVLYIRDDKCGFRLAPNQKKYMFGQPIHVNSYGMRGFEPRQNKLNIVFLGDSVTYGGARIPDDKTFVSLIDEKLSNTKFQALNAGVNNYGPKNIEKRFFCLKNIISFDHIVIIIPSVDFKR
jgi:hypothetical protein